MTKPGAREKGRATAVDDAGDALRAQAYDGDTDSDSFTTALRADGSTYVDI